MNGWNEYATILRNISGKYCFIPAHLERMIFGFYHTKWGFICTIAMDGKLFH